MSAGFDLPEPAGPPLDWRDWSPPGPIAAAFATSENKLDFLVGPYGSAKTTTCIWRIIITALRQPRCIDGVRRSKCLIVRDTYRELYRTFLPSWLQWFGRELGEWSGGQDRPATHILRFEDAYGPIELIVDMQAIGDQAVEKALDGYEPTYAMLNGVSGMSKEVIEVLSGRVGRYPARRLLPKDVKIWAGIFGDSNKCDVDHWFYQMTVEKKVAKLFDQPGGLELNAENIHNLQPGYYEQMLAIMPAWRANIFVHNKWGTLRDGDPVFEEFNERVHMSPVPLEPRGGGLYVGLDAGTATGGQPSMVVVERTNLQRRVLAELFLGRMGPKRFGQAIAELLQERFPGARIERTWADPAAFHGVDREGGEIGWVDAIEQITGLRIEPAPTNELAIRLDAVRRPLTEFPDGTTPALIIDPRCVLLRRGFAAYYRYKKIGNERTGRVSSTPDKNDSSHLQDALQYVMCGLDGGSAYRRQRETGLATAGRSGRGRGGFGKGLDFSGW